MALPLTAVFPQDEDIVGRWKLDEESGGRIDDVSDNDLTDNNTVLFAAGQFGANAADFEAGTVESLSHADNAALSITGAQSHSVWIKLESAPPTGEALCIASKWTVAQRTWFLAYQDTGGTKQFRLVISSALDTDVSRTINHTLDVGTWYLVTWTYSAGTVKIYVNGAQVGESITDFPITMTDGTAAFVIGIYNTSTAPFDGLMQDYNLWNVALTDEEVLFLYNTYFPPDAPTGLTVTAANASQTLALAWTDNVDNETAYYVERSADGSTGWAEIGGAQAANLQSYNDNVAAYSTKRYYRVRCYNSVTGQYSDYSNIASATTAPTAPTIGTVTNANASTVLTVNWTDNSSDETTFSIEASADGVTAWSEVATDTTSPYAHTVGSYDATRYYRVRAYRSGDTIYSAYSSVSTAKITAPAAPTSPTVANITGGLRLSWTDNSSTNTTFSLERKAASGSYIILGTDSASPYDDTDMVEDTTYTYRLRAYRSTDAVYSAYSAEASGGHPPAAPSGLVGACTVAAAAASKILLTWKINSENETGFLLERSLNQSSWTTVTTTEDGIAQYEDSGLAIDTTYYYRVKAVGTAASSAVSSTATVITNRTNGASLIQAFDKKVRHFPH